MVLVSGAVRGLVCATGVSSHANVSVGMQQYGVVSVVGSGQMELRHGMSVYIDLSMQIRAGRTSRSEQP